MRRILTVARNNVKSLLYCCDDVIMIEDGRSARRVGLSLQYSAIKAYLGRILSRYHDARHDNVKYSFFY